ncbi:uncharacterized protein TNCT_521561 [Trichonephila clavata]|uniref:Uncharacterized protein n=1 Tax=Trichonephila clavata TaxID=2740835 RepID=A0A8X6GYX5_TRICU|nr:uncharacterized protein TNCT_521561 [Trichonephila clavata]
MNSMIISLLVAALCYTAVSAGPYLPYRYGLGGVSSYYYSGAPFARSVAPYGAAPVAPVAPVPAVPAAAAVVPAAADYYALAASAALSYPGYGGTKPDVVKIGLIYTYRGVTQLLES